MTLAHRTYEAVRWGETRLRSALEEERFCFHPVAIWPQHVTDAARSYRDRLENQDFHEAIEGHTLVDKTYRCLLHPLEMPAIRDLLSMLEDTEHCRLKFDPHSRGEPQPINMDDGLILHVLHKDPSSLKVLQDVVQQFLGSVGGRPPEDGAAINVNAGLLLHLALALGEQEMAETLLLAAPAAKDVAIYQNLHHLRLGGTCYVLPAFTAWYHLEPDGLDTLARHGWSVSEACYRKNPLSDAMDKSLVNVLADDFNEGARLRRLLPSMVERLADHCSRARASDGADSKAWDQMVVSAHYYAHQNSTGIAREDIIAALDRSGLFDENVADLALSACRAGDIERFERFAGRLDWSCHSGHEFLPTVVSDTAWIGDQPEVAEPFLVRLCKLCIEAGHGAMLANPNSAGDLLHAFPIQSFARQGVKEAVLLALEQGADPTAPDGSGVSAINHAKKSQREDIIHLIRAHLAQREARAALDEMSSPSQVPAP